MSEDYDDCVVRFIEIPSTKGQLFLAKKLVKELEEIGMEKVELDEKDCVVFATLPSNVDYDVPIIGFCSHLDTSAQEPGKNVRPQIFKKYDGESDIVVNEGLGIVIKASENENLKMYKGMDIITTDGNTLLGSDDKAGIAAIVSAMKYYIQDPEGSKIPHGRVRVCFLPDEEIGCLGAERLDAKRFGCEYAYTLDACTVGEIAYENFNAASAYITIFGRVVHPGYAKNKMCNALNLSMEFHSMLPEMERPERTEDREGYYMLLSIMEGETHKVRMRYLIRDHDREKFEDRIANMKRIAKELDEKHENMGARVEIEIRYEYRNMGEKIIPVFDPVVKIALESMEQIGVKPLIRNFRGGTDGAKLSFKGIPCPNIFTGGENFHSRMEYLPIPSLVKAKQNVIQIIKNYAKKFSKQ